MKRESGTSYQCPSFDDLSAWHDSQLCDRALEEHLAQCPRCRALVRSFREIDQRLHHGGYLDEVALGRIKRGCRLRLQQPSPWRWVPICLRVAAAVAVAAAIWGSIS